MNEIRAIDGHSETETICFYETVPVLSLRVHNLGGAFSGEQDVKSRGKGDEKLSQEISFTDGSFAGRSLEGLERWFEEITIYPRTCSILEHDTMVSEYRFSRES